LIAEFVIKASPTPCLKQQMCAAFPVKKTLAKDFIQGSPVFASQLEINDIHSITANALGYSLFPIILCFITLFFIL